MDEVGEMQSKAFANMSASGSALVSRAVDHARRHCEPYLFNHVMRSWLFARRLADLQNVRCDAEIVAVSALLHDITLNERFVGPRRFEVEAADLAKEFVRAGGFDARRAQLVWDSVAINSTASIALYKEPEVAFCTAGIVLDVIGYQHDLIPAEEIAQIVRTFPRLDMKRRMTQCFCHIARTQPETT